VFYGENMQIFKNISTAPKGGEINHAVNAKFDEDGNLNFTEHDMGEGMNTSSQFQKKRLLDLPLAAF
jgi:hypothetical protein